MGLLSLVILPSGGACLSGRFAVLLLHYLQGCKAWKWDFGCGQRENNRFLFIAWSHLPLTLREPLHLQDVLPTGQRQVVCRASAGKWGTKLLLGSKGRGLHIEVSLVTPGRKCSLISMKTAFGRVCRAGKGNVSIGSADVAERAD